MKIRILICLLLFAATSAGAQEKPKRLGWQWWVATGVSWGMAVADVETQQRCQRIDPLCTESSSAIFGRRPSRGRMYSIVLPLKGLETFISYKLRKRESGDLAKAWWLPQFIGGGINAVGVGNNATAKPRVCPSGTVCQWSQVR